ncbi:glutaminyl-peptide cyclotransferase [Deinococcus radiopugnans]|uniref:Glutaminyl-peptide cyclotransferase n=1 Tax=Deinococcus radiopugnans ATCC 19172 TaxID=585398 RepID=A0ABR6NM98_9DEIO|nr:glutaminyl-peptide cyclotransferase [Deinococcus radiopugnans]MBB6015164.1 glutaminyl-peptide cyclotransferase [Deinococcus radiopugnans ATCC 19172]
MRAAFLLSLLGLLSLNSGLAQSTSPAPSSAPAAPTTPPVLTPTVVNRYPHDRAAFTEGLQYLGDGTYIESTGLVGESGVRRVELKTGKVLGRIATPLPTAFGEGVTVLGGLAYHLTWQDGLAFAFDMTTMKEVGRYRYSGEGWGLTTNGRDLIMSNGTPTLVWRDPKTFAAKRSVTVTDGGQPVKNLNELEYVGGSVYANIWLTDRIARIDPQTGKVTAWIDVSALTREASAGAAKLGKPLTFDDIPNGIAYVPERGTLLLTGKRWGTVFEVKVPGLGVTNGRGQPRR